MAKSSEVFKTSHSKVKVFSRCHYAYHLRYVKKLRKKKKARPLIFGSLVHSIIESEANGDDPFKPIDEIDLKQLKLFEAEREEYGDLINDIKAIMTEYFEYWKNSGLIYLRRKKKSTEHEFETEISPGIFAIGKIDGIGQTPNKLKWLVEHKTFTRMPSEDHRWRNLQSAIYLRIAEMEGFPSLDGTLWDYVSSKPPSRPETLKDGSISRRAIVSLPSVVKATIEEKGFKVSDYEVLMINAENSRKEYFQRIFNPVKSKVVDLLWKDFVSVSEEMRDRHEVAKRKNIDRHCDWCEFEPICRAELSGLDTKLIINKDFEINEKPKSEEDRESRTD